jgi:tRNA/tmRNA/rRNA uracil-C5-methylase (TrmA/RlmC/RlmD family)
MAIVAQSSIEPEMHYDIYLAIAEKLATSPYKELSEALNFIIIRDTGEKAIIFNVFEINGEIVRKLKLIAEMLQKSDYNIVSAWMYHDPNRSEYFLDHKDLAPGQMKLKKLFGFDMLKLEIEEIKFQLSPFILTQVNIPMLRIVVKRIQQLLSDIPSDARLLDLYCGYGLFSHTLSSVFSDSLGLDSSASGIESAKSLVQRRLKAGHQIGTLNFKETYITKDSIKQLVPQIGKPEYIIIDPPRQGTAEGVIAEIALRKPVKVIHIFCAIDQIVKAMAEWKRAGYIPTLVQALDMYPGTPSIETLVVLEPDTNATPTRSYRIRYRT